MPNQLSPKLLAEIYGQVSGDPFLFLVTLNHNSFSPIYLVNNSEDIVSRGKTFQAFPMAITLPADEGDKIKDVRIEFDNVSSELINEIRSIDTAIEVKIEMCLASTPDIVEMDLTELMMRNITYNKSRISATLVMDNFLSVSLPSEQYTPLNFHGLF